MGKITTYLIVMSGLMLIFYFGGLIESTPNSTLLNLLLSPSDLQNTNPATRVMLAIQAVGITGAVLLGFYLSNAELIAMAGFSLYLFNLFWDFLVVYNKVASVNKVIAIFIFSPILIMYVVTIAEFWRGRD